MSARAGMTPDNPFPPLLSGPLVRSYRPHLPSLQTEGGPGYRTDQEQQSCTQHGGHCRGRAGRGLTDGHRGPAQATRRQHRGSTSTRVEPRQPSGKPEGGDQRRRNLKRRGNGDNSAEAKEREREGLGRGRREGGRDGKSLQQAGQGQGPSPLVFFSSISDISILPA